MLRAIVVDDEKLTMERICQLLQETGRIEVLGGYIRPLEGMEQIFSQVPDVAFLDIKMPKLSGLELAEKIYESELQTEIIFITAYQEYALEAFKVNALDYLLKPVLARDLEKALHRLEKRRAIQAKPAAEGQAVGVSLFGGFNLWVGNKKELLKWHAAKGRELLAYFILEGFTADISKWKLIDILWPDKDFDKGYVNLRSILCRLNKTLRESATGMRIVSGSSSYRLIAENITVDALELQKLALDRKPINDRSLALYEAAVASYKAELLEDFDYPWCTGLRVNYQSYFVMLCRRLATYYLEQQHNIAALSTVKAWLKHDPYDEEAHYLALKLYYKTKGKDAACEYYRELCRTFEADLGTEPGASLKELFAQIIKNR